MDQNGIKDLNESMGLNESKHQDRYQADETGVPVNKGGRLLNLEDPTVYPTKLEPNASQEPQEVPLEGQEVFGDVPPNFLRAIERAEKNDKEELNHILGKLWESADEDLLNDFYEKYGDKSVDTYSTDSVMELREENVEEVELTETQKRQGRNKRGKPPKPLITEKDKLKIVEDYVDGVTTLELADRYNVSRQRIYNVLAEPEMVKLRKAIYESQSNMLESVFVDNGMKLRQMVDTYLSLALDEKRIKETSLPSLMTSMGIAIDKFFKFEDLKIKQTEIELKRQEINNNNSENGLMADFMKVMLEKNTLPKDDEEEDK